ncbi:helix-turn-helix transcriptional regulator [Kutzneria sp. CA-103260]|uniref:helix-turn-helix transcriptional regulator n=1 Tax=Kutzneria sp. CA-103260 TaxID=2802641 RepID=UPI001BA847F1|nr:helix-turn-helix transcriptional regulator [Kutzneria sp. CA-103260]QUQ68576.1 HTH-type transcriptional activator RhaS [Kutzneria sp. CA-103260]
METLNFDSDDLELTEEFLSKAYTRMRIGGDAADTHAQVSRNVVGPVSVDQLEFDYDMRHDANVLDKICLGSVHSGTIVRQYFPDGAEGCFGPGDVFVYTPDNHPYAGVIRRSRYNLILIEPQLLTQVAATVPGRRPEPVRLTGDRPVSPGAARHLRHTIAYLRKGVCADPALSEQPLLVSTASQCLAASVLNAFPNTALTDPTIEDRHDAHPDTVRRAVAFIDDHAQADLAVADIAAAIHVSVRTVQLAFRRHLGTTPMGYLRRVRLTHAHAELVAADPTTDITVTAIAARWGFFQLGRFAAAYRAAYGCTPHQTLVHRGP